MRPAKAYCHRINSLRLGEFDIGGVLYHANYFHVFEEAREGFLAAQGTPYSAFIAQNSHLAVVESYQSFDKPVLYGEPLNVYLWTSERRRTTVVFNYEVAALTPHPSGKSSAKMEETTVHTAWTRMVYVLGDNGQFKATRLPEALVSVFDRIAS